jgi:5-methylcytosine-specific restriction endonuclease McrA
MSQTKLPEKSCTKCGETKPLSEFNKRAASRKDGLQPNCRACESERRRLYRIEKREEIAAYQREWYENNREHVAQYREENREAIAETYRAWWLRNRDRKREQYREWYEKNRDEIRAKAKVYAAANLEKGRARAHKRRGATPEATPEVQALMRAHKEMSCYYCGKFDPNPFNRTTDHIIPVSSGLPNTQAPENLVPACRSCNCSKRDKPLEVWLKERGILGAAD